MKIRSILIFFFLSSFYRIKISISLYSSPTVICYVFIFFFPPNFKLYLIHQEIFLLHFIYFLLRQLSPQKKKKKVLFLFPFSCFILWYSCRLICTCNTFCVALSFKDLATLWTLKKKVISIIFLCQSIQEKSCIRVYNYLHIFNMELEKHYSK